MRWTRLAGAALLSISSIQAQEPLQPEPRERKAAPAFWNPDQELVDRFLEKHGEFAESARRFTPMVQASYRWLPEAEINNESGDFDLRHFRLDALLPLPLTEDTFLLTGLLFESRTYRFNGVDPGGPRDDTLYGIGPRIGLGHFFSEDFVVQGFWQPTINSDLDESLEPDDWKAYYGAVLGVYRYSDTLFLQAGIVAKDVADTSVLPLLGFGWMFEPGWRLDLLVPQGLELSYTPDERLYLMGGIELDGDEYNVRQSTPAGRRSFQVNVQEVLLYVGSIYRLSSKWSLSLKTGMTIAGRYEWKSGVGNRYDGDLEPGFFLDLSAGWTF